MANPEQQAEKTSNRVPKRGTLIGLTLALLAGIGGFYAAWSGMIISQEPDVATPKQSPSDALAKIAYVDVNPVVISLPVSNNVEHLRFRASLEVPAKAKEDVVHLLPRITDVFNSYLRAVEPEDFSEPSALVKLRGQLLRRIQVVAGPENINDLLVMEFVLN